MNNRKNNNMKRPPLGLTPKFIREKERYDEVSYAIIRYIDADKEIPIEWIDEYNELVDKVKNTNNE